MNAQKKVTQGTTNTKNSKQLLTTLRGPKAQQWFNAVQKGAGTLNPVFEENDEGVITHVNIYLEA